MRRLVSLSILAVSLAMGSYAHAESWFRLKIGPTTVFAGEEGGPPTGGVNDGISIDVANQVNGRIYGNMTIPVAVSGIDGTHTISLTGLPREAIWRREGDDYGVGAIVWATASEGTYYGAIEVRDAGDQVVASAQLEVAVHPLLTATVPEAAYEVDVGGELSIVPSVTGLLSPGAVQWGATNALPPWIVINEATGRITVDTTTPRAKTSIALTAVDQTDHASDDTDQFSITVARACGAWTASPALYAARWTGAAYGDHRFVAVGQSGAITSSDGVAWAYGASSPARLWSAVTYGNGRFVAVSVGGDAMTSMNGTSWTVRDTNISSGWTSIAYGNGLFVAVSQGYPQNWWTAAGRIMTSTDGVVWTARNVRLGLGKYSVAYGNGTFVAVSDSGPIFTSTDGVNWGSYASPQVGWQSVTYGDGKFVAIAASGAKKAMTSTDGMNWTLRETPASESSAWYSVAYGDGQFVAVGTLGNRIMTSPDGISWTSKEAPIQQNWETVTYGDGKFLALSSNGTDQVMTSSCN